MLDRNGTSMISLVIPPGDQVRMGQYDKIGLLPCVSSNAVVWFAPAALCALSEPYVECWGSASILPTNIWFSPYFCYGFFQQSHFCVVAVAVVSALTLQLLHCCVVDCGSIFIMLLASCHHWLSSKAYAFQRGAPEDLLGFMSLRP